MRCIRCGKLFEEHTIRESIECVRKVYKQLAHLQTSMQNLHEDWQDKKARLYGPG